MAERVSVYGQFRLLCPDDTSQEVDDWEFELDGHIVDRRF
jgi:hypothetical protein